MKPIPGNDFTRRVIGCAIEVHRELGPGLVESIYEACLCDELADAGLPFARQQQLPVRYKGRMLNGHYQPDIVVDDVLVLEIKAAQQVHPIHEAQLMTYLRLGDFPLGLLLSFNTQLLKNGVTRVLNPKGPRPLNTQQP
jgi:GxxExxY protein